MLSWFSIFRTLFGWFQKRAGLIRKLNYYFYLFSYLFYFYFLLINYILILFTFYHCYILYTWFSFTKYVYRRITYLKKKYIYINSFINQCTIMTNIYTHINWFRKKIRNWKMRRIIVVLAGFIIIYYVDNWIFFFFLFLVHPRQR